MKKYRLLKDLEMGNVIFPEGLEFWRCNGNDDYYHPNLDGGKQCWFKSGFVENNPHIFKEVKEEKTAEEVIKGFLIKFGEDERRANSHSIIIQNELLDYGYRIVKDEAMEKEDEPIFPLKLQKEIWRIVNTSKNPSKDFGFDNKDDPVEELAKELWDECAYLNNVVSKDDPSYIDFNDITIIKQAKDEYRNIARYILSKYVGKERIWQLMGRFCVELNIGGCGKTVFRKQLYEIFGEVFPELYEDINETD
jgi:hypothetical protein